MSRYGIRVSWSDEDEMFVALCPALGNLSALGDTPSSAVSELEQAIEAALETYQSENWPIPEPDVQEEYSGQFRLRLPRSLHAWLAHEAERQGVSLNSLVTSQLARAQGLEESAATTSAEVRDAINALKASLPETVRETVIKVAADSSSSWNHEAQPTFRPYGSQSSTLRLVESAG